MNRLLCSILLLLIAGAMVRAQQPAEQPNPDSLLEKRNQLKKSWQADKDANNLEAARLKAEQLVELERQQVEQDDPDDVERLNKHRGELGVTLNWLATQYEYKDVFDKAVALRKEYVGLQEAQLGKTHWQVKSDQLYLDFVELLATKTPAEHQQIKQAKELFDSAKNHISKSEFKEAIEALEERLRIQQKVLGADDHYQTTSSRTWLALQYEKNAEWSTAEAQYKETLKIYEKNNLGADHPKVADVRNNLAILYRKMGNYAEAGLLYRQFLEVYKRVRDEEHANTVEADKNIATANQNLGQLSMWLGDYVQAKKGLTDALQIREEVLGKDHGETAITRGSLALLYSITGDYAKAEPLYQQALKILDEPSDERAHTLENLGVLYQSMGGDLNNVEAKQKYAEAEKRFDEALKIYVKIYEQKHPSVINVRNNIAVLRKLKGDHESDQEKAGDCYHDALDQYKMILGEELFSADGSLFIDKLEDGNLTQALTLNNLASLYESEGSFKKAEPLYEKALAIRQEKLGEQHIETAVSLSNLGLLKLTLGHRDEAKQLVAKSLGIRRDMLDKMATVQTERQQLLMNQNLRSALDDWLSVVDDESAYAEVLRWKGTVFVRQAHLRALRSNPELKDLVDKLRRVSTSLAEQALKKDSDQTELQRLNDECQRLETELTEQSEEYREVKEQTAMRPADLQGVLPEKTALVDLLEYERFIPSTADENKPRWERRFVAFVVLPDAVHRIELGTADTIDKLVDLWREEALHSLAATLKASSKELRRLVWQPLEKHLAGIETVLISPDGMLGKLPFAALPGKEEESYLLEDYATAVIATPQTLVVMCGAQDSNDDDVVPTKPRMLTLGGVNYDAPGASVEAPASSVAKKSTGPAIGRAGRGLQFDKLSNTKDEASNIKEQYVKADESTERLVHFLTGDAASEDLIREYSPNCTHLHFATHGFFAPNDLVSALDIRNVEGNLNVGTIDQQRFMGYAPGLLSGLAFAGANKPRDGGNDGVLTALEIGEMDLSKVKLAVLSACETGLGRVAGGEGLLGLQRAFELAGSRSVVASLWTVDDEKTRKLMENFYRNYYLPAEDSMSTVECLRQAQLELLRANYRGSKPNGDTGNQPKRPRTAPFFWAAFVLSGDWR